MEVYLKIEILGHRKNLLRYIHMLKTIWIRQTTAYSLDQS